MFDPARGYPEAVHYVRYADPVAALRWLAGVLGAVEAVRMTLPDGRIGHAELRVGRRSAIAIGLGPHGGRPAPPEDRAAVRAMTLVFVDDVDAATGRAVELGGAVVDEPSDAAWGLRQSIVTDPEGYVWELSTHVSDVAAEDWGARAIGTWFY